MPIVNTRVGAGTDQSGKVVRQPKDGLAELGPVIQAKITLPDDVQHKFSGNGKQVPEAVTGYALIDTGASKTCFDEAAARKAGLPIIDSTKMTSASHADHEVPVFSGKIICPTLTINVVMGTGANLSSAGNGLIALIGRDTLKSCIFIYNGAEGHFSLAM